MTASATETVDVLVIGGGAVGCAVARAVARAGLGRVLLLEQEDRLGIGATSKAVGGVRHQSEDPVSVRMTRESVAAIAALAAEAGDPAESVQIRRDGYVLLATDGPGAVRLRRIADATAGEGVPLELLDGKTLGARLPGLYTDDVVLATWCASDGLLDPHLLVAAVARSARAAGVRFALGRAGTRLLVEHGRLLGVETPAGRIAAGACVLASGEWTPALLEAAGLSLPLRPTRRRIFLAPPLREPSPPSPLVMQVAPPFYFHAERSATLLSAAEETDLDGPPAMDLGVLEQVAARTAHRLPALADAPIRFGWSGLRVLTPDGRPLVGAVLGVAGLWAAVGLGGQGVMHSPIVAEVIAARLAGAAHPLAAALDPARFVPARAVGAG